MNFINSTYSKILFIIVTAQFCCTSLWFAGNAILPELQILFDLPLRTIGDLTSSVQLGFITGTFLFALLTLSDRYSPSILFGLCALLGSAINLLFLFTESFLGLLIIRFFTGLCLAGIYPVGMKISSDYFGKGLGKALGYLVGALVLGTALPHLISTLSLSLNWRIVIITTSVLAMIGGLMIYFFVPDGPYRKQGSKFDIGASLRVFKISTFRRAALGYFGHMWELYTMWAFIPLLISYYNISHTSSLLHNNSFWAFLSIGMGAIGCVLGGYLAVKIGNSRVAFIALLTSCFCCVSCLFIIESGPIAFTFFLMVWGMSVVADSPQFSTMVAQSAPKDATGSALTMVNSIGFAITIVSLQLMNFLIEKVDLEIALSLLAIGPILGLISIRKNLAIV